MKSFLDPVLNPVMQPLINVGPFWAILVMSFLISLMVVLVYKFATNQAEMKRLKEKQKEFQQKMKTLKDKPEELMKLQKEAMSSNFEYMKHSFKAMLFTMLPVLLLFGWMTAHLSYEPISVGDKFIVNAEFAEGVSGKAVMELSEGLKFADDPEATSKESEIIGKASWRLKAETEGEQELKIKAGEEEKNKKVLVTSGEDYEEPVSMFSKSDITKIEVIHQELKPAGSFTVPLINWQPGWLGWYIIFSLLFSVVLRKILNVY